MNQSMSWYDIMIDHMTPVESWVCNQELMTAVVAWQTDIMEVSKDQL